MRVEAGRLVRGTLWVSASRVAEGVIALVFSIAVARSLGGDYGYVGAAMGVFGILNVVSTLGVPQANTRYVASTHARADNAAARGSIYRTVALEAAFTMVASVALFLLAEPLAEGVFDKPDLANPLRMVAPMLFIAGLGGAHISTFQGLHRYGAFALVTGLNPVVRLSSALLFLALGWGVEGALLGYLLGHAAAMLTGTGLGLYLVSRDLPVEGAPGEGTGAGKGPGGGTGLGAGTGPGAGEGDHPTSRRLVSFGAAVTLGTMSATVFEWTDKLMLTRWEAIDDVAFYTVAFGMVALPLLIPRSINTAFYPAVASLHGAGDAEGLRRTTERVMRFTFLMTAFIPVGMVAIAPWLVGLLYGELFLPSVTPFLVLAVWGLVRPAGLLAYSVPQAMGRPMLATWVMAGTAVLNIGLNAALIPAYGMLGAAVATTASYVLGFSYMTRLALRMAGAAFPWSSVGRTVFSAVVAAVAMLALNFLLVGVDPAGGALHLLPPVLAVGFAGLGLYVLLLGLTRAVREDDARFIASLGIVGSATLARLASSLVRMRGGGQPPQTGQGRG